MIPGALAMMFGSNSKLARFVYEVNTSKNSSTVSLTGGTQSGDYVVVVSFDPGGTSTLGTPSGWDSLDQQTDVTYNCTMRGAGLNITTPISSITGLSARTNTIHLAVTFRGLAVPTVRLNKDKAKGSSATPTPGSVVLLSGQYPCFGLGFIGIKNNSPNIEPALSNVYLAGSYASNGSPSATIAIVYTENNTNTTLSLGTLINTTGSANWLGLIGAFTNNP